MATTQNFPRHTFKDSRVIAFTIKKFLQLEISTTRSWFVFLLVYLAINGEVH